MQAMRLAGTEDGPFGPPHDPARDPDAVTPAMPDDVAMGVYESMVLTRRLERRLAPLRADRSLPAVTRRGSEAAVFGAVAAMESSDWVFPADHTLAAALWRGMPPSVFARRALAVADLGGGAPSASPDGTAWKPGRVVDTSALPGRALPHAVGLAWAARLRKARGVVLALFGVEATSGGDFHAALNFAGVVRAPFVAVCLATPIDAVPSEDRDVDRTPRADDRPQQEVRTRMTRPTAARRALAYGIRSVRVDASDAVAVHAAVRGARASADAGSGGTLVEASLPPGEEPNEDPLERMRGYLESRGLWSADREAKLSSEVDAQVEDAVGGALRASEDDVPGGRSPSDVSFFDHVYAALPWHLREQRARVAPR
jgi:pyruvate dehydrogenase E1 component alpha subunit/2-oxoisovalerate dehydrogenase E1 component alpha subunit